MVVLDILPTTPKLPLSLVVDEVIARSKGEIDEATILRNYQLLTDQLKGLEPPSDWAKGLSIAKSLFMSQLKKQGEIFVRSGGKAGFTSSHSLEAIAQAAAAQSAATYAAATGTNGATGAGTGHGTGKKRARSQAADTLTEEKLATTTPGAAAVTEVVPAASKGRSRAAVALSYEASLYEISPVFWKLPLKKSGATTLNTHAKVSLGGSNCKARQQQPAGESSEDNQQVMTLLAS